MKYKDPMKSQPFSENEMRQARVAQLTQLYDELTPLEVSPFDTASADIEEFKRDYNTRQALSIASLS